MKMLLKSQCKLVPVDGVGCAQNKCEMQMFDLPGRWQEEM